MAMQYKVTASELKERYFTCERCGAFGEVQFHAIGEGGWVQESFFVEDAEQRAATQAADALQVDAERVIGMIRCPACKQRPKGAFTGAYLRVGLPTLLGLVAIFYGGAGLVMVAALCGGVAAWLLFRELKRLGRANRAMVYKLTKPAPEAKPEKAYKPLRPAKPSQSPRPATAPVAPLRTSAPEIVRPRGPEDGPGFLT